MPGWIRPTAILTAIYVAAIAALAFWMPVWHDLDWRFFEWISSLHAPAVSSEIALADVSSWDNDRAHTPNNRRLVAAFLEGLVRSKQQPKAVILDIGFGPCQSDPCTDSSWVAARATLERALRDAAGAGVRVYAAEALAPPGATSPAQIAGVAAHDPEIYAQLAGAGQTRFFPAAGGSHFYQVCYDLPRTLADGNVLPGESEAVWALVWRSRPDFDVTQPCNPDRRPIVVGAPLAPLDANGNATLAPPNFSIAQSAPFPNGASVDGKYVVVGTVKYDRNDSDRSGPELVTWALSDVLGRDLREHFEAHPQDSLLLFFVPAVAALVVLAFVAWFLLLRRSPLRQFRRYLPWGAAALAAVSGLAVLIGFESSMLAGNTIQPQITLVSLGIVLAAILCGVRGAQIVEDENNAIDPTATETYDYDVFISYAHEEGAWVFEHVYVPFRDAVLPNGKKLNVFFDTSSIRAGTAWQTKLALAIDGSKYIVPVYSDTYFTKPYCRFEILRAHRKWIQAGEDSRCVLPVMRGKTKIYSTVDDIQALSIDDHPDLVQQFVAEIVERVSRETPAAEAAAATAPGKAEPAAG